MTPRQQRIKALDWKKKAERRFIKYLQPWLTEIVKLYRPGALAGAGEVENILFDVLRRGHIESGRDVLGFDVREYKSSTPYQDVQRNLSLLLSADFLDRARQSTENITRTADKWIQRVSQLSLSEGWTPREADAALKNYLKNQSLIVGTAEAGWGVETTRRTVVQIVQDPLKNSVQQISELIRTGNLKAARALGTRVNKMLGLPLSDIQGKVVGKVYGSTRSGILTPESQANVLAIMQEQAEELGQAGTKGWQPVGDSNSRETHIAAGAQYLANPIPVEEPFIVGGFPMMRPGDGSLGAPLSEIINCRCAAIYY